MNLWKKYFNGDDFSDEEVLKGLKKGIADGGIVPVCSSAFQLGSGLEGLLDLLLPMFLHLLSMVLMQDLMIRMSR